MPQCQRGDSLLGHGNHDLEHTTLAPGARGHADKVSMVDVVLMAQHLGAIPDQGAGLMVPVRSPLRGQTSVVG
jgi:hypothetical protein